MNRRDRRKAERASAREQPTPSNTVPLPPSTPPPQPIPSGDPSSIDYQSMVIVGLFCVAGALLIFAFIWFLCFLWFGNHYLSSVGWMDVLQTVFFSVALGWLGIYMSIHSRYRKFVIGFCACLYVAQILVLVIERHLQESSVVQTENRRLCDRADSEARALNLSAAAFLGGFNMAYHDHPPPPMDTMLRKTTGHPPPYTAREMMEAVQKTEFGAEYQKLIDNSRNAFLQEAPNLEDISSQINKRLGVDQRAQSELDYALGSARGMPQLFYPQMAYTYAAKYMQSLSKKLCPVGNK